MHLKQQIVYNSQSFQNIKLLERLFFFFYLTVNIKIFTNIPSTCKLMYLDISSPLVGDVLLLFLLLLLLLQVVQICSRTLTLFHRNIPDPVREGCILRAAIERAQLDHVVDEADDGDAAGPLLLEVLDVALQVEHQSAVVIVGLARRVQFAVGQVLKLGSRKWIIISLTFKRHLSIFSGKNSDLKVYFTF
jgi:hypothetical protein